MPISEKPGIYPGFFMEPKRLRASVTISERGNSVVIPTLCVITQRNNQLV
jgi:hypothetical protein